MSVNLNIIRKWLSNKGYKSKSCTTFVAVHGTNKTVLSNLLKEIKIQFPNNNSEINDLSDDLFISIK